MYIERIIMTNFFFVFPGSMKSVLFYCHVMVNIIG